MPTQVGLHTAGDSSDLSNESFKRGLTGKAGGSVRPADSQQDDAPLGTSQIAPPTAVSAADAAGAGDCEVTYTAPSGITTVEIVTLVNATKAFVKKQDATSSPATVTGLTPGTQYAFYARGIASDGRVGRPAAAVTATPS